MEGQERRRSIEISPAGQIKPAGTLALKNFTIPRKKRVSGQAVLEPCPEESHEYTLIQSKLKESRLDMRKEHANDWLWRDVKLVHNEAFLKEYLEKRSEMRVKGRHGREMEERFCFLVASYETASQIYQFGLRTGSQEQYSLGKPSHGVYLFKHVDVALKHAATSICTGNTGNLIVFKVLFGKMKKLTPSAEWNKTADPVVSFDCHMAKDAISYKDSLSQQVLGSSVFLFDYNDKQELNQRPRQCLPYTVISFVPAVGATPPTPVSPPISPTKLPTGLFHGHLEHLKGCTVAERRGKGENATVTFKRFPSAESSEQEHQSQAPQADATSFQLSEPPTAPYNHQQQQWPNYSAEYFNPSTLYFDNGSWQNYTDGNTFVSNIPNQITMSTSESNTDESIHASEKISTIVYSSRLVKDPRLSRQDTNNEKKTLEQETSLSVTGSDKQECLTESQNHEEEHEPNKSCAKQSSETEEKHRKTISPKPSLDDPHTADPSPQAKIEPMPLSNFFKMKFQKYAAYFNMTKEERHRCIWSEGNLSTEQKKSLIDCINVYENYDQKHEQGEHLQNNVRTENAEPLNSENDDTFQPTLQNISLLPDTKVDQAYSVNSDTSNCISTTKKDTTINNLDKLSTDVDKTEHSTEFKENIVQKIEFQSDFQNKNSSEVEFLVKPLEQSALQMDPLEKDETSEDIADSEQQLCPFQQVHPKQPPICEMNVKESTLYNTIYEFDQHNIASIDIASCVDIPVQEVTESNDCSSATAIVHELPSQGNSENKNRGSLLNSEAAYHSEMSIEVQITEAQRNTTHNTLYNRLQLEQLLPSTNEVNQFSIKPYLRPKGLENLPDIHHNETVRNEENVQLIFKVKSSQTPTTTERLTLSDRFSKLRGFNKRLTALVQMNCATTNCNGDIKRDPGAVTSSYDLSKGNGISNAKLIQLMTHRYNEERLITNGKALKKKQSKLNGRGKHKSGELCKIASGQLLIHVLRKATLFRRSHLLKARKKYRRNLFSKRPCNRNFTLQSSHFQSRSETGDSIDKDLESDPKLSAANPQNQSKNTDNGFSQENILTSISIENILNTNSPVSENHTCHDDGISELAQSKEQHINHSTERVDRDVLYVPRDGNEDILEKETINISHQSSPIRHLENNESSNIGEINKEDHSEEDTFQKDHAQTSFTQAKVENYGTDNKADPIQSVLSIPAAQTTSNVINRCIAEPQTAVNNKIGMDTTVEVVGESADSEDSERCLTEPVVDVKVGVPSTGKSEEIKANVNIESNELFSHAKSIDANEKGFFTRQEQSTDAERVDNAVLSGALAQSKEQHANPPTERVDGVVLPPRNRNTKKDTKDLDQEGSVEVINLKTQKDDKTFVALNPSDSQNTTSGDKKVSRVIDSVEGTTDLTTEVIKENIEEQTVIKDNLHSDFNITPGASETRIITRLRDYLTRFESSVKNQESVNDTQKEHQVPMTWITLDSTVHKQILDTRHYNRPPFGDQKNPGSGNRVAHSPIVATVAPTLTVNPTVVLTKHKQTEELNQPTSWTSKRRRKSKAEGPSPDSTSVEPVRKESHSQSLSNKNTQLSHVSSTVPKTSYWLQNYEMVPEKHQTITPQGSGNQMGRQQSQVNQSAAEKANKCNEQALTNEKLLNSYVPSDFKVTSISSILKMADHAVSLTELTSLQVQCGRMLEHFTLNFEKAQSVFFSQSCITRKLILEKYLDHPPPPVELKFEAINSFLELQMMTEAWQFVENKISFLRKRPTFRSLLWYDPSLYGELYKGAVGFQQQSSLFSSFQQCLATEDFSKLREYYSAVSTLHQQLQDAPDTSYYMYLKTKRERLEVEAALRNPPDVKSFFLSVPVAIKMNFGDTLESLKTVQHTVTTFIETPADQLPGIFDVGKAEHLSIICRYLHEKALFLKSNKEISKVSWFGLEHLLYDASKVLVWSESAHEKSNEVLKNYKKSNPQIVYGVTEAGVTLVNKMDQHSQTMDKVPQSTPQEKIDALKIRQAEKSTEKIALNSQPKVGIKETNQPPKRRVTHPTMRLNFTEGGVAPVFPTSILNQPANPSPYPDFPQRSNSLHWGMSGNHVWDWTPRQSSALNPEVRNVLLPKRRMSTSHLDQRPSVPDQQNHSVRQHRPRPLLVKPRPVERVNHPPLISVPHHAELPKEQSNKFHPPIIKPLPLQRFPIDTTSMMPPPLQPLPFSNTLNPSTLQNNATISYPYFIFNGQTYSTADSTVPVTPLHAGTQYHPHPV